MDTLSNVLDNTLKSDTTDVIPTDITQTVYMTDALWGLMRETVLGAQKEVVFRILEHYRSEYQKLRKEDLHFNVQAFQKLIDHQVEDQKKKHPELSQKITCRAGCAHCCSQSVLVTMDEAELIVKYMMSYGLDVDYEKFSEQVFVDKKDWKAQRDPKCIFLDSESRCKIYKVRPMSCRKLHSLDEPQKCEDPDKNLPKMFVVPEAEITASACVSSVVSGSLPQMMFRVMSRQG